MTKFQIKLQRLMDEYVNLVYNLTKNFPKQEMYSTVSQWRRAALSIILNYIEGYARKKPLIRLNFLEISYGSLKECKYLSIFSKGRNFIKNESYKKSLDLEEEIGKMLWSEMVVLENSTKIKK